MFNKRKERKIAIREKKKIGVIGIGHCCGTSTIALQLAFFLEKNNFRTSFFELTDNPSKGALYYNLYFDKKMEHQSLVDFYQKVGEGEKICILHNLWHEINWAITLPKTRRLTPLDLNEKQHLLNNLLGQFVVCDVDFSKENSKVLTEFDLIFCVIDPLPSKIMENFQIFQRIKEMEFLGYHVVWIINKFNKGIHLSDLVKSLQLEDYKKVAAFSIENIYDCQFRCKDIILKKEELTNLENIFKSGLLKLDICI